MAGAEVHAQLTGERGEVILAERGGTSAEGCPSWPKERDWKSRRRDERLAGSNPAPSARSSNAPEAHKSRPLRHSSLPTTEMKGHAERPEGVGVPPG